MTKGSGTPEGPLLAPAPPSYVFALYPSPHGSREGLWPSDCNDADPTLAGGNCAPAPVYKLLQTVANDVVPSRPLSTELEVEIIR